MNVYSEIRDYVRGSIRQIDARYKEHNQPHTPDNIGSFEWDKVYFIRFNPVLGVQFNAAQGMDIPIEIEFGQKAGSDPIKAHDDAMCLATDLVFRLIAPSNYSSQFSSVVFNSITPEPVLTNERWTKITLSVTISLSYNMR